MIPDSASSSGVLGRMFDTAEMIFISTLVSVIIAAPCAILRTRSTSSFMPGRSRARIE